MELFKAHKQWAERPKDERFQSLPDMHAAVSKYRGIAAQASIPYSALRVEAVNNDVVLVGKKSDGTQVPATLTHWAFGQLAARAGAPAGYLRTLPATLASQNLNHGLKARGEENDSDGKAKLLFHANGSLIARAVTSEKYSRIWNSDLTARLLDFQAANPQWVNPPAYKDGKWGAELVPSGLYASDHDMFAFLVDESRTIEGSPKGLNRGFFCWNSEVGASKLGFMSFLYDRVCGNNIVWGASEVHEIGIRHVGNADTRAMREIAVEIKKYAESSASDLEAKIENAKTIVLGATKLDAIDSVMKQIGKLKLVDLNRPKVEAAISLAEKRTERYGNPYSAWGIVGGLTENSQASAHTDERVRVDRAAGKLLKSIAF